MADTRPDRRKSRVVDAPKQAAIVAGITAVPMGVLLVAAVVMWVLTNRLFDEAQASNAELPSLGALAMTQFLFVVLTGAIAVWEAWRYSHRVVGPARRIAGALRRLREGTPESCIVLRKGDELQLIVTELNPLIEDQQRRNGGTPAPAAVGAGKDAGVVDAKETTATEPSPTVTHHAD